MHISYMTSINGMYSGKFRSLKVTESLQITGIKNPTSGAGVEAAYSAGIGNIISYDRGAGNVYKPIVIGGETIQLRTAGATATSYVALALSGVGAAYITIANGANDPTLSTSAGAIKIPTMLQLTNYAVPAVGKGLELGYDTVGDQAIVQAYDRTGAAWKNIGLSGYNCGLTATGGVIQFTGAGAWVAGDKYLVISAAGVVRISAVGPAS